ncbi:hypothetical protein EI94DRAFT_844113 [Lactarius quietus]|nr:hypothetical protein EI94DRAFT_844113 [Lactarius quietus]
MSSLPTNTLLQGSMSTFNSDEGISVIYPQIADTATQLEAMRAVRYQLLQMLDTLDNVSNAAQLGDHHPLRESAISPQLEPMRVACRQLLQTLDPIISAPYSQVIGHPISSFEFIDVSGHRLLSPPHSSDSSQSLTVSCCKYMARCPMSSTPPSSEDTNSIGILRSLRDIRLLSPSHTSNSYWSLVISYCRYMACHPSTISGIIKC